jgi:hypothetical protein
MLLSAKRGLSQVGLLDSSLEPKPWVEEWIGQLRRTKPKQGRENFIDLSLEEYLIDPAMHLTRLWNHFSLLFREVDGLGT